MEIAATQTMSASADGRKEIQPAEAGFVCVDAVSTAWFLLEITVTIEAPAIEARRLEIAATQTMSAYADGRKKVQPAEAGFVCVDAVSTAGFLQPAEAGFVCVDAVSTAGFIQPMNVGFVCVDPVSTAGFLQSMNVGFVEIGIK